MTISAVYTIWCDGPHVDKCTYWIAQDETRAGAWKTAKKCGWVREAKKHYCGPCARSVGLKRG